ncbi:MAG: hypothetical protein AB7I35_06605 [Ramlibacter sp.]
MQPDSDSEGGSTVTFHRVYPAAIPPMRADKAALGIMPTMAFRHCEPMRTASSFGWYIFPPEDISLKWSGADVSYLDLESQEWLPLSQAYLPGFSDYWDEHAPEDMRGLAPPYLSSLPIRGYVQIWSGLLCATRPNWSVLVRPPVNIQGSHRFSCFEGLLESDRFQPFPLFMNIQLLATDAPIHIPKLAPLFQVQPLMRQTYGQLAHSFVEREGLARSSEGRDPMTAEDWKGYRKTIRVSAPDEAPDEGQYAVATRRRSKQEL